MRKIILGLILGISTASFSQENEKPNTTTTTTTTTVSTTAVTEEKKPLDLTKKDEIRLDPFYLVFGGALRASYERILNEESGVGVDLLLSNGKDINTTFSISPYYRFYFGRKPAAGFFFEGFGMYSSFKAREITSVNNGNYLFSNNYIETNVSDFAVGFGLGGKWITRKGVIFELSAGVGRNLLNDYTKYETGTRITGKGGLSIGYRF
jgi:Protein of unknown function (DUF3575)